MATKAEIKFTYEDYAHMSEDKRCELIEGEFFMTPSPITIHQRISKRIELALCKFVEGNNLGEIFHALFDIVLSDENVVQPDILFISKERSQIITEKNVQGSPDLVVEIISPATEHRDRVTKRKLYAKYDVREFWLVDPQSKTIEVMPAGKAGFKTVHIYQRDEVLKSPLLEGIEIPLSEVSR